MSMFVSGLKQYWSWCFAISTCILFLSIYFYLEISRLSRRFYGFLCENTRRANRGCACLFVQLLIAPRLLFLRVTCTSSDACPRSFASILLNACVLIYEEIISERYAWEKKVRTKKKKKIRKHKIEKFRIYCGRKLAECESLACCSSSFLYNKTVTIVLLVCDRRNLCAA